MHSKQEHGEGCYQIGHSLSPVCFSDTNHSQELASTDICSYVEFILHFTPQTEESTKCFGFICDQPPKIGRCWNSWPRYYYESYVDDCKLFYYSGCFGNLNNYASYEECMWLCHRKVGAVSTQQIRGLQIFKYSQFGLGVTTLDWASVSMSVRKKQRSIVSQLSLSESDVVLWFGWVSLQDVPLLRVWRKQ